MWKPGVPKPKAACVLIVKDGLVLATSRKNDPTAMGLPGGKVDPGEDPKVAGLRELKEETGISARPKSAVPILLAVCENPAQENEVWCATYLVTEWTGQPRQQPGEGRLAWVTWDELIAGPFGAYNRRLKREYDTFTAAYANARKIG